MDEKRLKELEKIIEDSWNDSDLPLYEAATELLTEVKHSDVPYYDKQFMASLTPEGRKHFIKTVTADYCKSCWFPDPNCQCQK